MRLIFITRKIDRGDALTGFVFTWIERLARDLDRLYVICQEKGDVSGLPSSVEVHSFGKEKGYGRLRQSYSLFVICLKLARSASGFFVHMHPIYAIVAWIPAKLFRKKMILWYTHRSVDLKLRIAHALVDEVFTASKESFRINSPKVRVVGHGIDMQKFQMSKSKLPKNSKFQIVSIGRISPVKDYETLIKAADILRNKGITDFEINIYGRIGLPEHQSYLDSLVGFVRNANLEDIVKFQGELNYDFVDEVYAEADLFVNLSATGSIDKAVLEAAASKTLVLTSNEAFLGALKSISELLIFKRDHPDDLAEKILAIKKLDDQQMGTIADQLHGWVEKEHNLDNLVKRIAKEFQT